MDENLFSVAVATVLNNWTALQVIDYLKEPSLYELNFKCICIACSGASDGRSPKQRNPNMDGDCSRIIFQRKWYLHNR